MWLKYGLLLLPHICECKYTEKVQQAAAVGALANHPCLGVGCGQQSVPVHTMPRLQHPGSASKVIIKQQMYITMIP